MSFFQSLESLESHTIENLLPDDDDLLASLVDEVSKLELEISYI